MELPVVAGESEPPCTFCDQLSAGQLTVEPPCVQEARTISEPPGRRLVLPPGNEREHLMGGGATTTFTTRSEFAVQDTKSPVQSASVVCELILRLRG